MELLSLLLVMQLLLIVEYQKDIVFQEEELKYMLKQQLFGIHYGKNLGNSLMDGLLLVKGLSKYV